MTGDAAEIGGYDPVRSFEPPRAGFDLGTASSDALSRRGLPRRPDPEREPYLAERWASVFGRPLSIVGAELASDPLMLRGRKDALTSYRVDGWAGLGRAIVRRGISDPGIGGGPVPAGAYLVPATFVSAEWEVPRVMGDPANLDDYLSIWVGLDGFPEADDGLVEEPVPGQILRGAWRSWPARVSSDGWRAQSGTPRSRGECAGQYPTSRCSRAILWVLSVASRSRVPRLCSWRTSPAATGRASRSSHRCRRGGSTRPERRRSGSLRGAIPQPRFRSPGDIPGVRCRLIERGLSPQTGRHLDQHVRGRRIRDTRA